MEEAKSGRRATVKEVARLAGVGTMTVSRVVNNSGYVGDVTRAKVLDAIQQLSYMPNQHAKGLRSNRSDTIALIVSDITNPFFTTIARGVEDVAREAGKLVLIGNTDELEAEEERYIRLLIQKGVDGVLLVPAHDGSNALECARQNGMPAVIVDRRGPAGFDSIRCDSRRGAFELGQYLFDLGHRKFAILAGPAAVSTSDDRILGFSDGVSSASISVLHGAFLVEDGARMALEVIKMEPRPTAIFAVNNFLMIGALNALSSADIRVPEQISMVGFDDLPASLITFPFLTVASQPAYDLGRKAAERLLRRIEEPNLSPEEAVIPTSLIIRSSATKPPG